MLQSRRNPAGVKFIRGRSSYESPVSVGTNDLEIYVRTTAGSVFCFHLEELLRVRRERKFPLAQYLKDRHKLFIRAGSVLPPRGSSFINVCVFRLISSGRKSSSFGRNDGWSYRKSLQFGRSGRNCWIMNVPFSKVHNKFCPVDRNVNFDSIHNGPFFDAWI